MIAKSLDVPSGFKQSVVGVIPNDWNVRAIGDVGNPVRGGSPRPAGDQRYFDGDYIPWVTVASLTELSESQQFVTRTSSFLTEEGSKRSRTLKKGTLILGNSGFSLGVSKILGIKCCANDGIAAILNLKGVNKQFLCYVINTQTKRLRKVVARGNDQPNLNTELIGGIKFQCPPLAEQEAIAEALGDADALIESLEQLVAKKRHLKQAAMQQLLTGKKRLPGYSGNWEERPLGEITRISKGTQFNKDQLSPFGTYPVMNGGREPSGYSDRYNTEAETIAISEGGNSCGFVSYMETKFWCGGHCYVVTPSASDLHKPFLFQKLKFAESEIMGLRVGSGLPNIQIARINAFAISYPSEFGEQVAIAEILSDMDTEIEAIEAKLAKARQIKQGMMQELLTGRTRLV